MTIRMLVGAAMLCGMAAAGCRQEKPAGSPATDRPATDPTVTEEPVTEEPVTEEAPDAVAGQETVWTPFDVETAEGTIACSLGRAAAPFTPPSLCIVLYSGTPDEQLIQRGAHVLRVPVSWPGLRHVAAAARDGNDLFDEENARLRAVNAKAIEAGLSAPGRTVLMGGSRDGFIALDAMAHIPEIGAAIACQTVTVWPYLGEFKGMEGNAILQKHDLQEHASMMAPRPVLLQIGYNDERVGTAPCRELAEHLEQVYDKMGAADRTELHVLAIKGHVDSPAGEDDRRQLSWLYEQRFIRDE